MGSWIIGIFSALWGKVAGTTAQNQHVTVNVNNVSPQQTSEGVPSLPEARTQRVVGVLFIDDDTRFKIVDILRRYPWIRCEILKDVSDFDAEVLRVADIVFVDIEDVGKKLWPREQGLGVVMEIHRKYPEKHIVIYSSSTKRDMTHPAFTVVKGTLSKDAQPSEFLHYIETLRST